MRGYLVRLVVSTVGVAALLLPAASINAARPTGYTARASFRDFPGDAVTSDGQASPYAGSIDRNGNFSFSTGPRFRHPARDCVGAPGQRRWVTPPVWSTCTTAETTQRRASS
jgi:hypothetical protein